MTPIGILGEEANDNATTKGRNSKHHSDSSYERQATIHHERRVVDVHSMTCWSNLVQAGQAAANPVHMCNSMVSFVRQNTQYQPIRPTFDSHKSHERRIGSSTPQNTIVNPSDNSLHTHRHLETTEPFTRTG